MGTDATNDKYSGALEVPLAPSRIATAFVAACAGATWLLVGAMPLPGDAALLLGTAVACLAIDALRRARAAPLLVLERGGAVTVGGTAGEIRPGSFVAPWLTIVRWRPAGARFDRTLPVVPDMLPAADFRQLRVMLLWD
jgi:hypothetical protein